MDIFSTIEGQSGENFGSALLSYLIFNSHEFRDAFIGLLSDHSPDGPVSYASHFSCRTEYPTTHPEFGAGRLDLLIQLDDVVVGIESKFFAQFQDNQPFKYVETLKTVASALAGINRTEVRSLLYVLCPESRKQEAVAQIGSTPCMAVITWEAVIACMKQAGEVSNPVAQIVMSEFSEYLKRRFSFVHEFERKVVHLTRSFPEFGSPLQAELVGKLWSLFPSPGGRVSNGKTWLGYYFYTDPDMKEAGWFGFVPGEEVLCDSAKAAELIVATTYRPVLGDGFEPVHMRNPDFIGHPGKTNAWRIRFDASWNSVEVWRTKLAPFWDAAKGTTAE